MRERNIHTYIQTEADRPRIDRQTDRQRGSQIERETE